MNAVTTTTTYSVEGAYMLTRRDFEELAGELKLAHPSLSDHDTPAAREAWRTCLRFIADYCKRSNARFDREKFYSAATPSFALKAEGGAA